MLEFYDPRCEDCKEFAPKYHKLANFAKNQSINVKLGKVDAKANLPVTNQCEFETLPAVFLLHNGKQIPYGDEELEDVPLMEWMQTQLKSQTEL